MRVPPSGTVPKEPMPGYALAAGVLGLVGVLPAGFGALAAIALGGVSSDGSVDPWSWVWSILPALQLWGALWLLFRRGWLPLVLTSAPGLLIGLVVAAPLALASLAAMILASSGVVRRWIADRPGRTRVAGGGPTVGAS